MTTSKNASHKILIVAAEASSCMYATELIKLWREQGKNIQAFGIGNKEMEDLGFERLGKSEDLAVVGLQEILSNWSVIKKAFYALVDAVRQRKPDMILLMDYPEFNMKFAKKVKPLGVPIVYYISPQIWAWRTYRVHQIKKLMDLMLVIFPFEKTFYQQHGVPVEFVGHPLVDMIQTLSPSAQQIQALREKLKSKNGDHFLGLMPGSRKSEIRHNLQTQIETAEGLKKQISGLRPVLLVAPSLSLSEVENQARAFGYTGDLIQENPFLMIQSMDTILCASGTATLMVGLCEKPMVIMYKMNSLSAIFAKYLVRHIPYFGMVNLILAEEAVPERFQDLASPKELGRLIQELVLNTHGKRDQVLQKLRTLKSQLGAGGGIATLAQQIDLFLKERHKVTGQ